MRYLLLLSALLAFPAVAQTPPRVGPLDARNNLAEIAAGGPTAQAAARANIGVSAAVSQGCGQLINGSTLAINFGTIPCSALQGSLLGAAGGVAGLDGGAHVPLAQLPTIPTTQISGLAASATTDTTQAGNISGGTLPAARLPFPGVSALGGVQSSAGATHQWISGISTSGVPVLSQPTIGDISGAGSIASQSAGAVSITGGTITGASVGGSVIAAMKCDGATDDLAAITTAIAAGARTILVPSTSAGCVVSGTITPQSNQTIDSSAGGMAKIKLVSGSISRLFNLTGLDSVTIQHLAIDGSGALAGGDFVRFNNTTNSVLQNNTIVNAPGSAGAGSVILAGASVGNSIKNNILTNLAGNAAVAINGATAQFNDVSDNYITGASQFSVRILGGASRNSVTNNRCNNSGIECYAVSLGSNYNRIIGNHGENAGDNCISIVGDHNDILGNFCRKNVGAIYLWGSANTVVGNTILDGGQSGLLNPCIGGNANYGGTGQNNVVTGNVCDDDQAVPTQTGITFSQPSYSTWTAGATVNATGLGAYWMYGLNIYQAGSSGTTGATPPTCTTGTCSDGSITWTYLNSFVGSVDPVPDVRNNRVIKFAPTGQGAIPYSGLPLKGRALNRNPDFLISQPFVDAATNAVLGTGNLVVDGWRLLNSVGGKYTAQRTSASLANYQYSETLTSVSAYTPSSTDFFQIVDRIEGVDIANLKWGTANALPLTLDFCLNTTGITGKIPLVLDDSNSTTFVAYGNVTATGTWQCFSVFVPGPTTGSWGTVPNQTGIRFSVGLGAGSTHMSSPSLSNTWQSAINIAGPSDMAQMVSTNGAAIRIAAVHLYPANTEYLPRQYGEELALAQHWYWTTAGSRTLPNQNIGLANAFCVQAPSAGSFASGYLQPPVAMFGTSPTITTYNPSAANANWRDVTAATDVAVTVDPAGAKGMRGSLLTTTGTVANAGDVLCIHASIDSGS